MKITSSVALLALVGVLTASAPSSASAMKTTTTKCNVKPTANTTNITKTPAPTPTLPPAVTPTPVVVPTVTPTPTKATAVKPTPAAPSQTPAIKDDNENGSEYDPVYPAPRPTTAAPARATPRPTTAAPARATPRPTTAAPARATPRPTTAAPAYPTPKSTTAAPSRTPSASQGTAQAGVDPVTCLAAHNKLRAEVGVPPLTWDAALASKGAAWAQHMEDLNFFGHNTPGQSDSQMNNLYSGTDCLGAVAAFGSEKSKFPADRIVRQESYMNYGHYSMIVWRTTTRVGCGRGRSKNLACYYEEPGNLIGTPAY